MSEHTQTQNDILYCPDVRVGESYRITLPSPQRERLDISHGDHVDMVLDHDDDLIDVPDVRVDSRYRATIPKRTCERYGIEEGDYVDVTVAHADDE